MDKLNKQAGELTVKEAAEKIGLTEPALRYHIRQGKIPARKTLRAIYIKEEDLDKFLEDNIK